VLYIRHKTTVWFIVVCLYKQHATQRHAEHISNDAEAQ